MKDTRPKEYRYWEQLLKHTSKDSIFSGELVYPRQFEIHLPGDNVIPCNLHCPHCAGKYFDKSLGNWEDTGLQMLDGLEGNIPYHIYGGAYTEPLLNDRFIDYIRMTKKHGNHFGIHTNGTLLLQRECENGWLSELNMIATDNIDYLSISIDAGLNTSWCKTKGTNDYELFDNIIRAIDIAIQMKRTHSIRLCYLISPFSDNNDDFSEIVRIAKLYKVDSLRFSIPFAPYNQDFKKVREYKQDRELPYTDSYRERLAKWLSEYLDDRPYIFYTGSEFTDIDRYNFDKCVYCYYQITLGADGYYYRCSTTATPTMKMCRVGKIGDDIEQVIRRNQNYLWDAHTCFNSGARCNRMGLEINCEYDKYSNNR